MSPVQLQRPQPAPRPIAQTPPPRAAQPSPPPVMRGQSPDHQIAPPRATLIAQHHVALTIPSPEQLGIDTASVRANLESSAARRQLDRFGAVCINLEKLADGRHRLTCLLATTNPNRNHRVDAVAATEEEAIRSVVEHCEKWAGGR